MWVWAGVRGGASSLRNTHVSVETVPVVRIKTWPELIPYTKLKIRHKAFFLYRNGKII